MKEKITHRQSGSHTKMLALHSAFSSTKYFARCHWHYLKWLHLTEVNVMEQHNYSHGNLSPFDNLPYRLPSPHNRPTPYPIPPTPPRHYTHTHTHSHNLSILFYTQTNHKMSRHPYHENCTAENTENAGLCFNPWGNVCCQGGLSSVNSMRAHMPLLTPSLYVYTTSPRSAVVWNHSAIKWKIILCFLFSFLLCVWLYTSICIICILIPYRFV